MTPTSPESDGPPSIAGELLETSARPTIERSVEQGPRSVAAATVSGEERTIETARAADRLHEAESDSKARPPLPVTGEAINPSKPLTIDPHAAELRNLTVPRTEEEAGRFVDRLAAAVRQAQGGGSRLHVRLNPPELGALEIEVAARNGAISARLEVQTAAAQRALLDRLPELRDSLAHNGTAVERIDVQLTDTARNRQSFDGDEQRQEHRSGGDSSGERHSHTGQEQRHEQSPKDRTADRSKPLRTGGRGPDMDQLDIQV